LRRSRQCSESTLLTKKKKNKRPSSYRHDAALLSLVPPSSRFEAFAAAFSAFSCFALHWLFAVATLSFRSSFYLVAPKQRSLETPRATARAAPTHNKLAGKKNNTRSDVV